MQMHIVKWAWFVLQTFATITRAEINWNTTLASVLEKQENKTSIALSLSRRKRFVTFPEGSSLQLVFCTQTSAIITIGDIFLFGNTAALAWALPSDPAELLREIGGGSGGGAARREDHSLHYSDVHGKFFTVPKNTRPIIPVFTKRSAEIRNSKSESVSRSPPEPEIAVPIDRKLLHGPQKRREFLNFEHIDDASAESHRESRRGLYRKLELLFIALGINGRECLLRTLCEVGASEREDEQGTIMEEMARALFTLHQGKPFESLEHIEYDYAHSVGKQKMVKCEAMYPDCDVTRKI